MKPTVRQLFAHYRCRKGHEWVGTPLPEEFFGLYAMSAMICRQCGTPDPNFGQPSAEEWTRVSQRAWSGAIERFRASWP